MYVAAEPVISLKTSTTSASEGYLTLSWEYQVDSTPSQVILKITEDSTPGKPVRHLKFSTQTQVHLSGFSDGSYSALLLDSNNLALSNTIHFEVKHRSLKYALILFVLGLVLFIALLCFVITLTRKTNKSPS